MELMSVKRLTVEGLEVEEQAVKVRVVYGLQWRSWPWRGGANGEGA